MVIQISTNVSAQFGPQQVVSTETHGYPDLITADLDGDSDQDILIAGEFEIAWFENTDGLGLYGGKQLIAETFLEFANTVSAADLDGDGDLDVLSCFSGEWPGISKIVWNENLDGQGNFGPQRIINDNIISGVIVIGADIDNDSDIDVVTIESGMLAWYKNLDGTGNFGSQITISSVLDYPVHAVIADIDNDGDVDIITNEYDGNKIVWFENLNGLGAFSDVIIISSDVIRPIRVFCSDIDIDGDLDVVSTSLMDNKIAWYENIDGLGAFGSQLVISTEVIGPRNIYIKDLDNDGDQDILSSYRDGSNSGIVWLGNLNGAGNFTSPILISDEVDYATAVYASDLDQDQDFDILSASQFDSKIAWYENLTILNSVDFIKSNSILYPNPLKKILLIKSDEKVHSVKIFDQTGKLLLSLINMTKINTGNFQSGLYLVQVLFENGKHELHKMIKE